MGADFYITGAMRSGTTYLAAILNSQDECACTQDSAFIEIQGPEFSCREEFTRVCQRINQAFPRGTGSSIAGFPRTDLYDKYWWVSQRFVRTKMIGFKSTMIPMRLARLAEGSKVIIMTRSDAYSCEVLGWSYRLIPL